MPSKEFLQSRKRGEVAQKYVAEMLRSWGLAVIETKRGYHPGYDGIAYGKVNGKGGEVRFKYEVKYDLRANTSGNLYLDIPSLSKSQAGILVICLGEPIAKTLVLAREDALRFAVAHQNARGGEFNESACLLPIQEFIDQLKPQILKQPVAA